MRRSLANRADRLERALEQAQDLAQTAPPVLPDLDELEEMEDHDRERLERLLDAITLAGNPEMVREEIAELRTLAVRAEKVEREGVEAKLAKLEDLLRGQGFFDRPDQRLVLFTEFKDTLDYLIEKLEAWGFKVASIHGGMKPGSRDEPGTRLHAEQQFREGAVQVLVATEAAGEGINLQVCNVLFNYDIPWNPNRPRAAHGAHPPLRPEEGLPDLQLRRHEHHRGARPAAPARQAAGDSRRPGRRRRLQRRRRGAAGGPRRARAARLLRRPARR